MKTLNEKEGKNVKFLTEKRINFCLVQLTETILTKSLFDATTPIRAFLKNEGIHDFEHQQNGQEAKVRVNTHILTFSRSIDSETTLYRAGARGDERMWFGAPIADVAEPDNVFAIFSKERELYLINISKMDIESAWNSSVPNPISEFIAYQIDHPSTMPDLFTEVEEDTLQEVVSEDKTPAPQQHLEVYSTNFQPEEGEFRRVEFRMTNLKAGETHRFIVVGTCLNRKDEVMFEVVLPNDPYNNTYRVFPLRCQNIEYIPDEVTCYVRKVDEIGRVWLVQDEYEFLSSYYLPNQIYSFTIVGEVETDQTDKHIYKIRSEFNLEHSYVTSLDETHQIGEQLLCMVSMKRGDHQNAIIFFHQNDAEVGFFSPKDVFEGCNHADEYEKYFVNIDSYRSRSQKLSEIIDSMNQKIESYNRLWIFDYCNALKRLSITSSRDDLDEIEAINNLLHDVEIWMLEESGLMSKFSPEKREDTRIKSEQVIQRTEVMTRAIQIIREGKQVEYLEGVLAKLRKSAYLRNREQEFDTLYSLISLQQDFLKENMVAFSELIDFTSREFIDTYVTERIVITLSSIIKSEKKRINTELHFLRQNDTDTHIFSDLIIGIGTLLNFRAKNTLENDVDYDIRTRALFQELCKYLSLMAQKEDAIILINKAIEASVQRVESIEIKSKYLREVPQKPQQLIDYIKSMQFGHPVQHLRSIHNNVCAEYKDGGVYISHIPNNQVVEKMASNIVYTIPGTSIHVTSLSAQSKWLDNQPISYYKKQWKELLAGIGIAKTTTEEEKPKSNLVPVQIQKINKAFPNLVFCHGKTSVQNLSGAISFNGYLPGVWLGFKIIEIFQEGLHLLSEPNVAENGKINFSITANIREYSNHIAAQTDKVVNGVFISYKEDENTAVFITENGIVCEVETTERNQFRLNWTYELVINSSTSSNSFPKAEVLKEAKVRLDKKTLLRKQLLAIDLYNVNSGATEGDYTRVSPLPYLHLLIDNYVRLFRDTTSLYNVYHTARLFAILEQSTLADYYSSCIQYLEMVEGFSTYGPQDSSIPDFNWDDQLLSMFPSLQAHTEKYNLLKNFGSENDMEYLYRLSTREQIDDTITKLARISLAASLVENVTDDEQVISMLRGLVAKTLGSSVEKAEPILAEAPIDTETEKAEQESITNYGSESQVVEFKTSIVYPAGSETNEPNLDEQMNVIMRAIDGFLNARGGTIFVGVKNDGTPSGIEPDLRALNCDIDKYERIIRDRIVREFNKDVNGTIEIAFTGDPNCRICRIHIPAYINAIDYRGEFFQRQGNEVRILKGNDLIMFIRRRIEGKEIIIEPTATEPVPELPENLILPQAKQQDNGNRSTVDSTMVRAINPQYDNNQSFDLYFYKDGSCQLGYYLPEEDAVACIAIDPSMKNMYIIQCYNNGCVNKMPVRNLYNMQFDYRYKNALYKDAVLQKVMIISNEDYVLITSRQQTNRYVKLYPIWDISAHASLGLRGNQLLSQNYEVVEGWYLVHKEDAGNCEKLITTTRSNLGWKLLSPSIRNEVIWLNNNVFDNK